MMTEQIKGAFRNFRIYNSPVFHQNKLKTQTIFNTNSMQSFDSDTILINYTIMAAKHAIIILWCCKKITKHKIVEIEINELSAMLISYQGKLLIKAICVSNKMAYINV